MFLTRGAPLCCSCGQWQTPNLFREGSIQKRVSPIIQQTHTGCFCRWIIQSQVPPLTLQLSACEHKCLSTWQPWQGWDLPDPIAHPRSRGWILKCWEKGETLAVATVYIYLLFFGMTNFTPKWLTPSVSLIWLHALLWLLTIIIVLQPCLKAPAEIKALCW